MGSFLTDLKNPSLKCHIYCLRPQKFHSALRNKVKGVDCKLHHFPAVGSRLLDNGLHYSSFLADSVYDSMRYFCSLIPQFPFPFCLLAFSEHSVYLKTNYFLPLIYCCSSFQYYPPKKINLHYMFIIIYCIVYWLS